MQSCIVSFVHLKNRNEGIRMKAKSKKNILMLCLLYFVSFISFALPYGYMQTFLVYVGYDVVERGIILSGW